MTQLFGTYECKMDAKGRLLLPALLKKQLAPLLGDGFIMKRSVFEPCLELYTMQEWQAEMNKINTLNRFSRKNTSFIRQFTAGVKPIELDGSGRMLIPKELINFSGLKKDLVLQVTVNNIIEIWDKDSYENAISTSDEDFSLLAEEVMGDKVFEA